MNLQDLFVPYKSVAQPIRTVSTSFLSLLRDFLPDPEPDKEDSKTRAKRVVESLETSNHETKTPTLTKNSTQLNFGETVNIEGMLVPKSFLENKWKLECGSPLGTIDEKHRKGIVVRDNNGNADNKMNAKTYGPGLLYHPETGKLMQDEEPAGGFSTEELTRLFYVHIGKMIKKGKEAGCKTWYLAVAFGGIAGNFGINSPVTKKLKEMILKGESDLNIFNFIAHASDNQRNQFPGLITRRMWEARLWIGDYDPNGYRSDANKQKVKELNSA